MSLSNTIVIPLELSSIDVFTFGESFLFGYDVNDKRLIAIDLLTEAELFEHFSIEYYAFTKPIRDTVHRLVLNENETIIALLTDQNVHLVFLPRKKLLPSSKQKPCQCPIKTVIRNSSDNHLNDFIWITPRYFFIVGSSDTFCHCDLYICSIGSNEIQHRQRFPFFEKSKRKISLERNSDTVQSSLVRRKTLDSLEFLLFTLQTNGDIYLLRIDQNQLTNNNVNIASEFIGPIQSFPTEFDNYSCDYSHSKLICFLSMEDIPLVIFTTNENRLYQCILLNPSIDSYFLFNIDSITLSDNKGKQSTIEFLLYDQINSNHYFLGDSSSNIYLIEPFIVSQLDNKKPVIQPTNSQIILHQMRNNHHLKCVGLIHDPRKGLCLHLLVQNSSNRKKELIIVQRYGVNLGNISRSSVEHRTSRKSLIGSPCEYPLRPNSLLNSQLLSNRTLSSNLEIEQFIHVAEENLDKQNKAQQALENKAIHLSRLHRTQEIALDELEKKCQELCCTLATILKIYQKEKTRRDRLSKTVNDILLYTGKEKENRSTAETLMHEDLQHKQRQTNLLFEKIRHLHDLFSQESFRQIRVQSQSKSLEKTRPFIDYFQNEIDRMKRQLENISFI